jgi:pyridoxal biosynthesis lyase PdxS
MTNNLTEAVRRIRQLQQDIDRLQSGGDEGVAREIRSSQDISLTQDAASANVRTASTIQYDSSSYGDDGYS